MSTAVCFFHSNVYLQVRIQFSYNRLIRSCSLTGGVKSLIRKSGGTLVEGTWKIAIQVVSFSEGFGKGDGIIEVGSKKK